MTDLRDQHPPLFAGQRQQRAEPACERGHKLPIVAEAGDRLCRAHVRIEQCRRHRHGLRLVLFTRAFQYGGIVRHRKLRGAAPKACV
jgi:hypothetical protein